MLWHNLYVRSPRHRESGWRVSLLHPQGLGSCQIYQDAEVWKVREGCWEAWHRSTKLARCRGSPPFGLHGQCLAPPC